MTTSHPIWTRSGKTPSTRSGRLAVAVAIVAVPMVAVAMVSFIHQFQKLPEIQ